MPARGTWMVSTSREVPPRSWETDCFTKSFVGSRVSIPPRLWSWGLFTSLWFCSHDLGKFNTDYIRSRVRIHCISPSNLHVDNYNYTSPPSLTAGVSCNLHINTFQFKTLIVIFRITPWRQYTSGFNFSQGQTRYFELNGSLYVCWREFYRILVPNRNVAFRRILRYQICVSNSLLLQHSAKRNRYVSPKYSVKWTLYQ